MIIDAREPYIVYNGISSSDYNIIVSSLNSFDRPVRKITTVDVPGRSGKLIFEEDAWENILLNYEITVIGERSVSDLQMLADALSAWLNAGGGYHRLEDNAQIDTFRLAAFESGVNWTENLVMFGKTKISFDARPERFLKAGERQIQFDTSGRTIHNPEAYASKPLIRVNGTGAGTVTVGGVTVSLTFISKYVYLDCDSMNAYRQRAENKNNTVIADEFPTIPPGSSVVGFTGGVTSVEITPRWWRL